MGDTAKPNISLDRYFCGISAYMSAYAFSYNSAIAICENVYIYIAEATGITA